MLSSLKSRIFDVLSKAQSNKRWRVIESQRVKESVENQFITRELRRYYRMITLSKWLVIWFMTSTKKNSCHHNSRIRAGENSIPTVERLVAEAYRGISKLSFKYLPKP